MAELSEIAYAIKSSEEKIKNIARKLRESNKHSINGAFEKDLYLTTNASDINYSVCAIDGGLLAERLHGVDILIGKALAVNFKYSNSKLLSYTYFPQKFPPPTLDARFGLDEHESQVHASLFRLKMEIKTAIDAIENFLPDVLLFDGSLLPLPNDIPKKDSIIYPEYAEVLALYAKLYEGCKNNCALIGVIKDTRSKRLVNALGINEPDLSDSRFANFLLKKGERTCIFPYAEEDTPTIAELKKHGEVYCFYIKSSERDLPLRIEFLNGNNAKEIPEIIRSLSSISENYAYPAALIEADLCAAMDPKEMENIKSKLSILLGSSLRPLRRDARPFR